MSISMATKQNMPNMRGPIQIDADTVRINEQTRLRARCYYRLMRIGIPLHAKQKQWLNEYNEALYQSIGSK